MKGKIIYTIGHSTRSIEDFIDLLRSFEIEMVIDVRTIPKSRFNPQYNEDKLEAALKDAGIRYKHLTKLGGIETYNERFCKPRMEKFVISRFCRLHADAGL